MYRLVATVIITTIVFNSIRSQGESLFNDNVLHEIHFNQMDTTMIGTKQYQMVNMIFDGENVDSVAIKDKGNISAGVPNLKLPLKIKTNKYVNGKKYDGIKEFTLHNNFQDPTMMREKLTYEICAQLGLFSLRTAFARVYINNTYWGVYTIVEGKDEMYKHKFDNRDADAVESLDFGDMCFISNNPDDYNADVTDWPYYELENGEASTAFPRFAEMIDKANNTPAAQYLETVADYLNLEHFFTYQAANVYLMNFDSYIGFKGNQIYLYDTLNTIWQVVPWDFNASLNLWDNGSGTQYADAYQMLSQDVTEGCIGEKMNEVPELKNYYLNAMCQMANDFCTPEQMNSRIDFLKNQIQEAVEADWRKVQTNAQFDEATEYGSFNINGNQFEGLKTFFEERYDLIAASLQGEGFDCSITTVDDGTVDDSGLMVFPNPASDFINLKQDETIKELKIYDLNGRNILRINNPSFPLDVKSLIPGMYVIKVQIGEVVKTTKLFVQ